MPALLGVSIFLLFRGAFEEFFLSTIGEYVFSPVTPNASTHLAFVVILIFCGWRFFRKFQRRYIPSRRVTSLILAITIICTIYRLLEDDWDLSWEWWSFGESDEEGLRYLDAIFLVAFFQMLLWVQAKTDWLLTIKVVKKAVREFERNTQDKRNESVTREEGFFCDEPLNDSSEGYNDDHFGYNKYASKVADQIIKTESLKSFAIGISGNWGSGKTSFINLMKRAMNNMECLVIDFEPWNSQSPQAIIQDFFDTLRSNLVPYHGSVGNEIEHYAEKLIAIDENSVTKSFKHFLNINSDASSEEYAQRIEESIREVDKRIVVFIDDCDRLNRDEIFEVLRLIRNTANFPKTYFIVGYDRNYLLETLSNLNNSHLYLEKIFQSEISLPTLEKDLPFEHLKELLLEIKGIDIDETELLFSHSFPYLRHALLYCLKSYRDSKRLANNILLNYMPLSEHMKLHDSLVVEALRLKHPEVINLLATQSGSFLFSSGNVNYLESYVLSLKSGNPMNPEKDEHPSEAKDSALHVYLMDRLAEFRIDEFQALKISEVLKNLFKSWQVGVSEKNNDHLSVTNPHRFDLYFRYSLGASNLSEPDFIEAREEGFDSMKEKIELWARRGVSWELAKRFMIIKHYSSKKDFETVMKGTVYTSQQLLKYDGGRVSEKWALSGTLNDELIGILRDSENKIRSTFYSDRNQYGQFIKSLLSNSKDFDSQLLMNLLAKARKPSLNEKFPLSNEILMDISIDHFRNLTQKLKGYDKRFWDWCYLLENYKPKHLSNGAMRTVSFFDDRAKKEIQSFILNNLSADMLAGFIQNEPRNKETYRLQGFIEKWFDSYKDFDDKVCKRIDAEHHDPEFDQFKEFLGGLSIEGYDKPIYWDKFSGKLCKALEDQDKLKS